MAKLYQSGMEFDYIILKENIMELGKRHVGESQNKLKGGFSNEKR
jgi:hypothetical protein